MSHDRGCFRCFEDLPNLQCNYSDCPYRERNLSYAAARAGARNHIPKKEVPQDVVFGSTKCYEHVVSVAFRQFKANSHCNQIHGYALTFKVWFEADELDNRNWVVDFGSLKPFKAWLENTFDHKLVVAVNDPDLKTLKGLGVKNHSAIGSIAEITLVEATGCEAFALMAYRWLENWLFHQKMHERVQVARVEVSEHGGNSGYVRRK